MKPKSANVWTRGVSRESLCVDCGSVSGLVERRAVTLIESRGRRAGIDRIEQDPGLRA